MKKYLLAIFSLLFICSLTSCDKNAPQKNILGGYGDITQGAYNGVSFSCFFEDDTYIYFSGVKINKISGKVIRLCETPGCSHNSSECVEFVYKEKIFPGKDRIFYTEGTTLYELDEKGNKSLIAVFDTGTNGMSLDKSVRIERVTPVSDNALYVSCQEGSCIYNLDTGKKVYAISYMVCGDEKNVYYYDDTRGIIRIDMETMESNVIADTKFVYPCCCMDSVLYCNTDAGTVYSIDEDNNIEAFLTERNKRFILLGAAGKKLYYMYTDWNAVTEQYSFCDLYSCNADGEGMEKLSEAPLEPDMQAFVGDKALYLLETGKLGEGQSVYLYNADNNEWNTYALGGNAEGYISVETTRENEVTDDINHEELPPVQKSFSMGESFYSYSIDELTGNEMLVQQKNVPFRADGSRQKTIYQYYVEVEGYPEEGEIYIFVLCGGIFQPVSVNGNGERLINFVTYKNKEEMRAEIEFAIGNSSYGNEIIIGTYFADSVMEDDFEEFYDHHETADVSKFMYKSEEGYEPEEKKKPEMEGNSVFLDIFAWEDGDTEEIVNSWKTNGFAVISDRIPIGRQRERWSIVFDENTPCYGVFGGDRGRYDIYLLVDDEPAPFYGGEYCLTCNIISEYDTAVFEMDINDIVDDNEKHIAKFLVYDYQMGMLKLQTAQIIQKKE